MAKNLTPQIQPEYEKARVSTTKKKQAERTAKLEIQITDLEEVRDWLKEVVLKK